MKGLLRENIRIAFNSIKSQLLRTVLTVIIIAIGITSLVGILTVVTALDYNLSSSFSVMGANTFNINQYEYKLRRHGDLEEEKINPSITYSDANQFKNDYNFPLSQTSISFVASANDEVKFENLKTDPEITVIGIDESFLSNNGLELTKGRNFLPFDIINNVHSCIVGSDFVKKGILKDVNPLNKIISIRGSKFKIIGVLKEKGSTFGNSQDLRVFIPFQLARSLFSAPNINYTISVKIEKTELFEDAVSEAYNTMRKVRGLRPSNENNFGISRSDDLINKIAEINDSLNYAAWIIGIITILSSSIALMNIMIVSVTERTREIGIRKAMGAKKKTIATQFFIETITIGQIGGIAGIILGISIGYGLCYVAHWDFIIPWKAISAAFITSFIVAIISGLHPAIKASRLDPIEALRYE